MRLRHRSGSNIYLVAMPQTKFSGFGGPCGAGRSSGSARRAARGQIFLTPTAGKIIH